MAKNQSNVQNDGYEDFELGFPSQRKFEKIGQEHSGEIVSVTKPSGWKSRLLTMSDEDGNLFGIGESTNLQTLFDSIQTGRLPIGSHIKIKYIANKKTNQPQPMKEFTVKVKRA